MQTRRDAHADDVDVAAVDERAPVRVTATGIPPAREVLGPLAGVRAHGHRFGVGASPQTLGVGLRREPGAHDRDPGLPHPSASPPRRIRPRTQDSGSWHADLLDRIPEARPRQCREVDHAVAPLEVRPGCTCRFGQRRVGVELHPVRLNPHDGTGVCGEHHVRDLREHGVAEVLDHEGHPVGLCPAGGEQGARLRLAGLQGHARPAQGAPSRTNRQSCALSSMNSGLRALTLRTSMRLRSRS